MFGYDPWVWFISENHPTHFPAFEMFLPKTAPAEIFSPNPSQMNKRCGTHGENVGIRSRYCEVLPTATPPDAPPAFSSAAIVPDARHHRAPAHHPVPRSRA